MRMPTCCAECEFINMSNILKGDVCNKTYKSIEDEWVRAEFCPLIEIKEPHGRLIDADTIEMPLFESETDEIWMKVAIDSTSTIIDKEETKVGCERCMNLDMVTYGNDAPKCCPNCGRRIRW